MTTTIAADLAGRRAAAADPAHVPSGRARSLGFRGQLRAKKVTRNGKQVYHVQGMANTYEQPYEMWDMFGPYTEVISEGAGAESLAKPPDVAFLTNHRGVTMARTTAGTLELLELVEGLQYDAYVNPDRQDVRDLVLAIDDGNVTESSFAFLIEEGRWSPDYTEFRIVRYDIDRGDVSAVNYGANPYTSVAARSREILADLERLPAGAALAAIERLTQRQDVAAVRPPAPHIEPGGMSLELARSLFDT